MTKNEKYKVFKKSVLTHLANYKNEVLSVDSSGKWRSSTKEFPHILPKELKSLNLLPTVHMPKGIEEHIYSHHLNSSQFMCINFFQPLFNDENGNGILLNLLNKAVGIKFPVSARIIKNSNPFEYRLCEKERTSFDLHIKLTNGIEIFFEIKYTENGFGKTGSIKDDPNKYKNKWRDIYIPHLEQSLYLHGMEQDVFYKDYQIWRNVSYVRNDNNYTVFVIPYQNESLTTELTKTIGSVDIGKFENVKTVYWNNLVSSALELSRNTDYYRHFKLFEEKYLNFNTLKI